MKYLQAARVVYKIVNDAVEKSQKQYVPSDVEIAAAFEGNEHADQLFEEGVLFVFTLFASPIFGVAEVTIEGVGSDPLEAAVNFLAGADLESIAKLSRLAQQKLALGSDTFGAIAKNDSLKIGMRRGVFLKRHADTGGLIFPKPPARPDEYLDIDMDILDRAAAMRFISLTRLSSGFAAVKQLEQARVTQEYLAQLTTEFEDAIRRAGYAKRLEQIMSLRLAAIEALKRADAAHSEAQKWSKVAKGWSLVSNLLSLSARAYTKYSDANANQVEQASKRLIVKAQQDLLVKLDELNLQIEQVELYGKEIKREMSSFL